MGWDAVVFGDLRVPAAKAETWLTTAVSPADFKGWPDFFDFGFEPRAPEVLMEELKSAALEPHEFLDVALDGSTLAVRGAMAKDPLLEVRMPLAVLWRSAALHGAKGELVFFGSRTISFGYRVSLEKGKSTVKLLTKKEQAAIEKSKAFKEVDARASAALEGLLGSKPRKGSPFSAKRA